MNARILAVLRKELRDFRRNKLVVGTMVFLPIVLILIPIANVLGVKAGTPVGAVRSIVGGATLTFFLVPLILPTVIAGYAVVGEREQGTLEPVLTTPVRREELLIGKALSAILPSVAIAYILFAIFVAAVRTWAVSGVVQLVWQPYQFVAAILFAPLLSAFSIWVGLAISARSSDVRVAQQLSALSMLPMIGLITLFTVSSHISKRHGCGGWCDRTLRAGRGRLARGVGHVRPRAFADALRSGDQIGSPDIVVCPTTGSPLRRPAPKEVHGNGRKRYARVK